MFNETIYNVIIAPHIEGKLFRKRSNFTKWIWTGLAFFVFCICYSVYDFINKNNNAYEWVNTVLSICGMIYILWALYCVFYNPLRKYHISLQVYFYLLFMDYFYFKNNKYPNGFDKKMQYVIIVQTCIDSIDKYIKMLETLLISGDNTIAHIKYLRALRNLLYKMKGEAFFKDKIKSFRSVLDNNYASTNIGLKAVLDFDENVEYFEYNNLEIKIQECIDILGQNEVPLVDNKLQKDDKISASKRRILMAFSISIIIIIASSKVPYSIWNTIIMSISVLADLVTVLLSLKDNK